MDDPAFRPGFRLSALDVAVLVGGTAAALVVGARHVWLGIATATPVGHFFLYCNVIRLPLRLELPWAGAFVLLVVLAEIPAAIGWPLALAIAGLCTVVVVTLGLRLPSYHGVGSVG